MSVDVWRELNHVKKLADVCAGFWGYQGVTSKTGSLELHRSLLAPKQLEDAPQGLFQAFLGFANTVRTSMRDSHVLLALLRSPHLVILPTKDHVKLTETRTQKWSAGRTFDARLLLLDVVILRASEFMPASWLQQHYRSMASLHS